MDLRKIFIKDACPTKMGGQAVMEGIMMKGEKKTALAVRLPNGDIKIDTEKTKEPSKWMKVPLVRGVFAFVGSLVLGTRILMKSADILEEWDDEEYEETRFERWLNEKYGSNGAWTFMMYAAVAIALVFTVGVFIILPTAAVSLMKLFTDSVFWLNFVEGVVRIALFVIYVWAISFMSEIKRVFQFHGAEHKTIHCYENGLELTPENCRQFPTLHPRCGTSFLMFVFIIAFVMHFLMGWPNLFLRVTSRLLVLPVIAGLSYELLRWAGRSDNIVVKVLSLPGLYLQKITTKEPDDSQLEVAIAAINAVQDEAAPIGSFIIRKDGTTVVDDKGGTEAPDGRDDTAAGSEKDDGKSASCKGAGRGVIGRRGGACALREACGFAEEDLALPLKPALRRRRFI